MIDDAYSALKAIHRGQAAATPSLDAWINAFKTVKWVVRTETGLSLTAAGRQAYTEMSRTRSSDAAISESPAADVPRV